MRNLTFKAAMLNDSRTTVNRQSTDGQSQRHYKQTPLSKRWKVLMTLVFLFTLSIGQMWGAVPDYESYDWSSSDAMTAGLAGNTSVTISVVTGGSDGNVSGHYYKALNSAIDGSATGLGTHLTISSASQIDSVEIFFCPNGTNNTNLAWAGWGESVTPSAEVGTNYGSTASVKSSKSWANAVWQKIDLSSKEIYTLYISRQGKKLTNSGTNIDNFGSGQTVNLLGLRVWLHKHTVTLNPNGGGYTSTPEGWTASAGKYTKAVLAGSLALPEPAYAGNTFAGWKNKNNEDVASPITVSKDTVLTAQWTPTGGTTHNITYNEASLKGQSVSGYPTTYYEGTGIASFNPLDDVTDWHFNGWDPASISGTEDQDVEVFATWVAAYNVTFSAGDGSGTVPSSFQKWEGATFELPGQGSMVAPSGKAFDGWKANGAGDKLAANAEYTMGNDAVEFVAQWKAVPQTIYYWQSSYSGNPTMNSAVNVTGGTIEWKTDDNSKSWANESYNKGSNEVPADLQVASGKKAVKSGGNALYAELTLAGTATFQEGDTIYVGGYKKWMFSTTKQRYDGTSPSDDPTKPMSGDIALVTTGSGNSSYDDGYAVIPAGVNVSTMYLIRGEGATSSIAAIKVVRPAQKDVKSTVYDLTAVKINGTAISAADLATLKTGEDYLLDLATEYPVGPTVKFARKTTITYEDDSQKVTNDTITVTATEVSSKWQAQATIGTITYTVKMAKVSAAKVYYYDGSTKLGEETVAINGNPAEYADYQSKDLSSFVGWYDNSGLTGDAVTIASATITKDTTFYGKWNPVYAQSANLEQWVLDYGKTYDAWAQLGALGYSGSFTNSLDSLDDDPSKTNRNYAYLGFKVKNESGKQINFRVANGNTVKIKFGHVSTTPKVQYNNTGDYADMTITEGVYTYIADGADAYISIKAADNATLIFKQIMIGADPAFADVTLPWRVTYDANGGTCATAEAIWSGAALILPDVTPAESADYSFAGWYDGDDLAGAAGANYTATKNVTLQAHYAPVEYAVNYSGGEGATGTMTAGAAGWGTMVTPDANAFEKTGHVFSGWEITKTSDGSATGITFSEGKFEMPKYDVTLVAQWEDNSTVVKVVREEYEQKYDNFLDARNDVRDNGGTIVVLQDIENMSYYGVNAAITIDLNGHRLATADGNNMFLVYDGGSLTINGAVEGSQVHGRINVGSNAGSDGTLVLNGGTYTCAAGNTCIHVHGESDNSVVTINGASLASPDDNGVQFNGKGVYTVTNATISGGTGIYIKSGVLTITNSTVTGTLTPVDYSYNGNGSNPTGDGIVVDACNYPGGAPTINIISGDFSGTKSAVGSYNYQGTSEPAIGGIEGGTFSSRVPNDLCAENFVPSEADPVTGKYTVEPKDATSLIKAVATAKSQDITGENLTGIYKGAAHINAGNSYKFEQGSYFMVQLKDGENFQAGDIVKINVASVNDCNGFALYSADEFTSANLIIDTHDGTGAAAKVSTDINEVELPNTYAGSNKLYVARCGDCDKYLNAGINQVEVTRVVYPELKAITINGRDGEIDALDDKHFTVTIPNDANLASLTVVPTIVRNAPHATTPEAVISNEGAWVLTADGDNTYRIMDKDGDYTDYTITLIRDVLKHTVRFMDGASVYASDDQVEDGATVTAPATDPTKDEYIFKGWSETIDGEVISDWSAITITADKDFYAIWEAEPAGIKLINGDVVNHTNFLTGTNETTVEIESVEHKCVDFTTAGSNRTTVASIADLKEFIQYNATTNKAKIKLTLYNTKSSAVSAYLHMLEEGSETPITEEISIPAGEVLKTDFYEFNSEKNRSFYITCGNRDYIKVLQVKVIDDGTTTLKKAGQVGYSVNTLKSRIFAPQQSAISFEGLTINANAVCKPLSNTALKIKNAYNISFHADAAMTLAVTTEGNQTYYVSTTADGTTNETSFTGRKEFEITAGDWYIHAGSSELKVAKLEFIAPKCEQPTVVDMENIGLCEGDAFTALTVSASVTDGGTLHYQWFKHPAAGDDEAVGTDAASYTPEADGQYYVVVTNQLADHSDNSKTSNMVTVEHFASAVITTAPAIQRKEAGQLATLTVEATGKAPLTYQWYTCADEAGSNPVIIEGADEATYEVTVTVGMSQYYKVVVGSGCGSAEAVTLVEEWHEVAPANVTGSRTWDWAAENMGTIETVSGSTEYLMANVSSQVPNTEAFRSDMLYITANYANRSASNKFFQGWQIRFYTEVPGKVSLNCRAIHGTMSVTINGTVIDAAKGSDMGNATTPFFVPAGWVTIAFDNQSSGNEGEAARVQKIVFNATPDYTRNVTEGRYGTICLPNGGVMTGAELYEIAYFEPSSSKIFFDQIINGEMVGGTPYIFLPKAGTTQLAVFYTDGANADAGNHNGLYGSYTKQELSTEGNNYILLNNQYCQVINERVYVGENRAYIKMNEVSGTATAPAPGRRRISMSVQSEQVATGIENTGFESEAPRKVLINGELYIIRGEKMYDAKGQLVK